MSEILRTRDCVVFYRGDSFAVAASSQMLAGGWLGGQGLQWIDSPLDDFRVTYSEGIFGGFALWGSDEPSDQYVSFVGNQIEYDFVVFCTGNWFISTSAYEKFTYASRQAGPLVPITYTEGEKLHFSLRGYWTNEDEWTLSGDPRAPNTFTAGLVMQRPSSLTNDYLGIQTTM